MFRFIVGTICKQTVERRLDVPYDTFFPSGIVDGACSNRFVRLLWLKFGLEAYIIRTGRLLIYYLPGAASSSSLSLSRPLNIRMADFFRD